MDYENLVSSLIKSDKGLPSQDSNNFYVERSKKEINQKVKEEVEKAKAFLSIPSPTMMNTNLYDHLTAILVKVIREKVENSIDVIEDISRSIKTEKFYSAPTFIQKPQTDENALDYVYTLQQLIENAVEEKEVVNLEIKQPEEDDDEYLKDEETEEETVEENVEENVDEEDEAKVTKSSEGLEKVISNLCYHMPRFELGGVGLCLEETFKICLAMKALVNDMKLTYIRFWGKIWATNADYYIAETLYREDIKQESFGWGLAQEVQQKKEDSEADEVGLNEDDQTKNEEEEEEVEEVIEEDDSEKPVPTYIVIPPVPARQPILPKQVATEENGTGVNKYLYLVCTQLGLPWVCLPRLEAEQITAARQSKKFLSGKLNSEIRGCPPFPGKEAHYLRAQIARISAGTIISPEGYYCFSDEIEQGDEQEPTDSVDEDTSETDKSRTLTENPEYQTLTVKEMLAKGIEKWVHHREAIFSNGRCTMYVDTEREEENMPEEETEVEETGVEEISEEKKSLVQDELQVENPIPLLQPLSMDKKLGNMMSWSLNASFSTLRDLSVIIARSNIWPGAYNYYDGRTFENIYIGFGHKFSLHHYTPSLPTVQLTEYPYGPDITEHDPFQREIIDMTDQDQGESTEAEQ